MTNHIESMAEHVERTGHTVENKVDWPGWKCSECTARASGWDLQNVEVPPVKPFEQLAREADVQTVRRPSWDEYFLDIATTVATRADCTRSKVGAVIVDTNRRIVSTGYNGAPSGGKSCLAGECPRGQMSKEAVVPGTSYDTGAGACIALHAEQNALLYSSWAQVQGGDLYVTREPCDGCLRMIKGSGLRYVVWRNANHVIVYRDLNDDKPKGYILRSITREGLAIPTTK